MNQLFKTELHRRLCSITFICSTIILVLYNIWDMLLTDFDFEVGWCFFLFQKNSIILLFTAIHSSLSISQDICGKTIHNKIILGFQTKQVFQTQIAVGIIETLCLFLEDTGIILIFSLLRKFMQDVNAFILIKDILIIIISMTTISVLSTTLAAIIPHRILSLFVCIGISLIMFQKGNDLTIDLIQPVQTIFYNESEKDAPIENPLYITGKERDLCHLKLLISPYAQVQYGKYMLFEEPQQNHFEFIFINMTEILILYYVGNRRFKKVQF